MFVLNPASQCLCWLIVLGLLNILHQQQNKNKQSRWRWLKHSLFQSAYWQVCMAREKDCPVKSKKHFSHCLLLFSIFNYITESTLILCHTFWKNYNKEGVGSEWSMNAVTGGPTFQSDGLWAVEVQQGGEGAAFRVVLQQVFHQG